MLFVQKQLLMQLLGLLGLSLVGAPIVVLKLAVSGYKYKFSTNIEKLKD